MIIAFGGQKQSGKDTSCDYIESLCGFILDAERFSFAEKLKRFCIDVLGLTEAQCYGSDEDKNTLTEWKWDDVSTYFRVKYSDNPMKPKTGFMTAREVMQVQGEMQRKFFNNNIWVNAVLRDALKKTDNIINLISDCRHRNEVEKCLELGGNIIHLKKKTNSSNADSEKEIEELNWQSYKEKFPNQVFEIDNTNMTIEEKNAEILKILKEIGVPLES